MCEGMCQSPNLDCCRPQTGASPERSPYKPEGAPWRAALSEHATSNSTVGGVTGAALLKEWQQLQEHAKKPRWCGCSLRPTYTFVIQEEHSTYSWGSAVIASPLLA